MVLLFISKLVVLICASSCCFHLVSGAKNITQPGYGSQKWNEVYLSPKEVKDTIEGTYMNQTLHYIFLSKLINPFSEFKNEIKIILVREHFDEYGRLCITNSGQHGVLIHYHKCKTIMYNVEYKLMRTLWLDSLRTNDTSYYRMICCVAPDLTSLLRKFGQLFIVR